MVFVINGKDYYSMNFLEKRKEFLRFLQRICNYSLRRQEFKNSAGYKTEIIDYDSELKFYKMQKEEEGFFLPQDDQGNYLGEGFDYSFNSEWDTRNILLSEGVIEIEKGDWKINIKGFWDTCINLIKNKIHFAVFYAEGMRTPHIHIYDLFPDCKDWAEKEMAMAIFCRKIVPFEYFHLIDTALWGEHPIALEFSKHYKYGTMNKLLFEYPFREDDEMQQYYKSKGIHAEALS